jgi:hypothetical protein
MPVAVNHASQAVIFQDYHSIKRKVAGLTAEFKKKKCSGMGIYTSFCCSGVKASFRKTLIQKLLQSYEIPGPNQSFLLKKKRVLQTSSSQAQKD